ncbi:MAG: type I glyceraldehyde-3-phosphate dehydrogenase [Candidatus Zambryskibacteria bacterium RIFCSPHIGHO2_02_FULL_43_14]|uniref:Type I glyceraldehyde-3-phosphate dehydrogenase n=1 Tax=Candidatus Zambryskibacteria bacterium RIFCSPHIGHO2_02_FULL_43_14 TaxID=1802748 RepID=A0A1G2THU9_9BACT|nr:MAG: type I glyceraldehyde-3-phosphate dehydrogenase [Candidatus Zambryskibacteria bacterium RIFCSPHIGHO2_01_FULL_43_60]OHA96638.1 MAG: type I glyceraldehyde-3-phosphate dehydrogenase [Candidatus Zambryskibacteria bacterium RIFCSPHIGHO2_02_FULL_43_14]OHB04020.1 MAG: type I glyceraldehyde-3-phosphate dehydrogenase [Candidatus Zambryskibacteria bacterium RIFCSPLOWO2_01_FULL_42_41]
MTKVTRVAINGAGRIGRAFYKLAIECPEIEVVAINDLGDRENIEYLLRHDTVYGKWNGKFDVKFLQEKNPSKLPWKEFDIDIAVESTGFFTTYAGAKAHLDAGAKRVVVTAPMKDEPIPEIEGATVLMGVNEEKLATCQITSNASCTTNAGSPLIAILDEALGIEKALLNTTHGYTASQSLVDGPSKRGFREGRAAAANIVPSSTGAAIAVTKAFTKLQGLFDGISMRVPVAAGSIVDVTFIAKRETSVEEINSILKKAAGEKRWEGVFTVTEEELVSSDILGSTYGSIADLNMTRVVGGTLVKVVAWYDNEMGYAYTLVNHVIKLGQHIKHE